MQPVTTLKHRHQRRNSVRNTAKPAERTDMHVAPINWESFYCSM